MQRFTAFLIGVFVVLATYAGIAYAQTYPSQPTFLKFGAGIGPNTTEVQTEWGGPTPLGFGVIAQQTNGDGGELVFLARETGVDTDTNFFSIFTGLNGSLGQLGIRSQAGNEIEIFPAATGLTSTLALGIGGTGNQVELRPKTVLRNTVPEFLLDETDAPANERCTAFRVTGGNFNVSSADDNCDVGAGTSFFVATRAGLTWDAVTLGGQSLSLFGTAGSITAQSITDDITLDAGDGIGDHIILANNAGDSTDVDVRGSMFNSTGSLEIFDTLLMQGAIENIDGSAASPAYRFSQDVNTGWYRIGADNVGLSLGGALSINYAAAQFMPNYNGTAALPAYSWNVDPDMGLYRIAADNLGISLAGAIQYDFTATDFDLNDNSIDDSVDNNVNIAANATVVGNLVVTGTITGGGGGSAFGGYTDSAATAENVPTGWSVSLAGNTFTWTHNLGVSPSTDLAVTVTPQVGSSEACRVNAIATNSFDVICYTTSTGSAANVAHFINAVIVNN